MPSNFNKATTRGRLDARRPPRKGETLTESYLRQINNGVNDNQGSTPTPRVIRGGSAHAANTSGFGGIPAKVVNAGPSGEHETDNTLYVTLLNELTGFTVEVAKPWRFQGYTSTRTLEGEDQLILPAYEPESRILLIAVSGEIVTFPRNADGTFDYLGTATQIVNDEGNPVILMDLNVDGRVWAKANA